MKRFCEILILMGILAFVAPVYPAQGVTVTDTLFVRSSSGDGYNKPYNGTANITSTYAYIGNGFLIGWRFEGIPIPPGSAVQEATLEVFCHIGADEPVSIRYVGEAVDGAAPFSGTGYDMINRPKTFTSLIDVPGPWLTMGWNASPDLSPILQEIIDRPGWRAGNAVAFFAEETSAAGKRGVYMMEKGDAYAARLHVTYTISKIDFDTNGDGSPDMTMKDADGDGYFECPVGKTEYTGTLTIDKPLEIMGFPATRTETLFKGDGFMLKNGGQIISDLTSPIVSSYFPGLKGNDLQVVSRDFIWIQYGAKILLGGDSNQDFDGDVYLEATRPGADVEVKEDALIHGRHIDMITYGGAVSLRRNAVLRGNSHMKFRANLYGDIRLNRDVTLQASSVDGDCFITFTVQEGDLHMNRNIFLNADVIDFCGVQGNIWDDGTVTLTGKTECW
ncbi:MAG: hypothetical protein C4530_17175 [Desulfobacteraceae bacterium]|nr:MAG: hypothetical protein C4530_17175 [Desulfobacteraceae bacterium]